MVVWEQPGVKKDSLKWLTWCNSEDSCNNTNVKINFGGQLKVETSQLTIMVLCRCQCLIRPWQTLQQESLIMYVSCWWARDKSNKNYYASKYINPYICIPCQVEVKRLQWGGPMHTPKHWQFNPTLGDVACDSVQDNPIWILYALHMLLLFFPDGDHLVT